MNRQRNFVLGIVLLLSLRSAWRAPRLEGATGGLALGALADQALRGGPEVSRAAVAALRAAGPPGMEALLAARPGAPAERAAEEARWRRALDAVCAQRDCAASRLYWYTDFGLAKAAALASGKPILSLRLLGRLDEEMSCANSRFFRTVLYPDAGVSRLLRDRFILHWRSVRPVPRLTIDFGDGRRLEGTITGNSIHYVLDPRGRLVDAIPGLYGAPAFQRLLEADAAAVKEVAALPDAAFGVRRGQLVAARRQARAFAWLADGGRLDRLSAPRSSGQPGAPGGLAAPAPSAKVASRLALSKSAAEVPSLRALALAPAPGDGRDWPGLAALHPGDGVLDEASRAQLRRTYGPAGQAELERVTRKFERVLAIDSIRNEYTLHDELDRWLLEKRENGLLGPDLERFNERVYAELFLTPSGDPWLGLAPADTFTGLAAVGAPERGSEGVTGAPERGAEGAAGVPVRGAEGAAGAPERGAAARPAGGGPSSL
ncbi:MAG TPA: hypothetical protein VHR45_08470 [Thermoanaerobaculia bacterium]|nr:hypothetical protein [Thermoanaerobaculia bacterium]